MEIDTIEASGQFLNPVTLTKEGGVYYCNYADYYYIEALVRKLKLR
ncbi:hypothetical protein JQM84_13800 [Parabacteroides distasonis]|nr:hypothetical protein [Parabacteroides distasonis]